MNTNFRGRVSLVTTMTRLRAGRFIPRNPGRLYVLPPLLKPQDPAIFSNRRLFQRIPVIYSRVKRPETEVVHSHPSSVKVKSECVFADIYSTLCVLMVSTENIF